MKEIGFEVCPYGDSGNGTATAAWHSAGYSDWTGGMQWSKLGGIRNWGCNGAVKTNRLVGFIVISLDIDCCQGADAKTLMSLPLQVIWGMNKGWGPVNCYAGWKNLCFLRVIVDHFTDPVC